jgi:hypothetical protein
VVALHSRRCALAVCVAIAIAQLLLTGCNGSTPPTAPTSVVLLDTTLTLVQGVTCNTGYVGTEFTGVTGTRVSISATGAANLTPLFVVYAPDFATQLGGSSPSGAGAAALTLALTQSGLHHLSVCDLNGVAGTVRVIVMQP